MEGSYGDSRLLSTVNRVLNASCGQQGPTVLGQKCPRIHWLQQPSGVYFPPGCGTSMVQGPTVHQRCFGAMLTRTSTANTVDSTTSRLGDGVVV